MDTKTAYNGYPAPNLNYGQEPPYGYQQPSQYPQPQYPPQYAPQPPAYQEPPHSQAAYTQPPPEKSNVNYPRGLEVAFTSWSGRHLKVTEDTHDGPVVYAADLKCRKPHMLFESTGTAQLPASVTFHCLSRAVDLNINGEEMTMKPTSKWKYEFAFESNAARGKTFKWKKSKDWFRMNFDCVDENDVVFARFKSHKTWSGTKAGRIEILEPAAMGGKGLSDELVVTCLADVYLQLTQTMSANSAAGASAGAAAAVST